LAITHPSTSSDDGPDTQVLTPPAETPTLVGIVPRLADGIELIGRFEDSGFKEAPYIARRSDGQVVQMKPMLFALAEEVDGNRAYDEIATSFSERIERGVTAEMVEMLIEEQLRPLGIVAPKDGHEQELGKVDPLLALKFRTKVVPQRFVSAVTRVFAPLFHAPVVGLVIAAFVALDVWLFGIHGLSQGLRHVIYQPALVLMLIGGVVVATAFHEIGHATACRFGGAKPGVMGVGVYIVWPAFYTDITDAYRLDKKGRLRTDLGGMYFNMIFALCVAAAYAVTGFEPLVLLIVLQTFVIFQQSMPFLRLDGYYVISDLTGVPDILLRMRSILTSVLPWRKPDARVRELKPWVRVVVTGYLLVLVPAIAFMFITMLMHAPRVFATGWDSFWVQWDRVGPAFDHGQTPRALLSVFQMIVLVLPAAGLVYTTARVVGQFGTTGWKWSSGSPLRRGLLVTGMAAALCATAFLWWPNGTYKPIQPGERGTVLSAVKSLRDLPSGRAALPPQRERQLGGAPTERRLYEQGRERSPAASKQPATGDANGAGQQAAEDSGAAPQPQQGEITTPDSQSPTTDTTAEAPTTTEPSDQGQTTTAPQPDPSAQGAPPATTTTQQAAPPPQDTQAQPGTTDTTTTTPTSP
jgi:putative peptide zinc metalloprotease protein